MQVHFSENEEFCLEFAKKIVAAKIHNQMVVCRRYQRNKEAEDCLRQMKLAENKISCCQSREEVMGYEGIAAREYFKALALDISVKHSPAPSSYAITRNG